MLSRRIAPVRLLFIVFLLPVLAGSQAADAQRAGDRGGDPGGLSTPLTEATRDRQNDSVWLAGRLSPSPTRDGGTRVLWTDKSAPSAGELEFAADRKLGPRHLMLVFKQDVPVGTVLMRGNTRLSVLRPGIRGQANPADESHWIPGERLDGSAVTQGQPADGDALVAWVLPPRTSTRAIRLTHEPDVTAQTFAGRVGGLYVIGDRLANVAPQGRVRVSANMKDAQLLTDGRHNGWKGWSNEPADGATEVSEGQPQWVRIDFPEAVQLRAVGGLTMGAAAVRVEAVPASAGSAAGELEDDDWQTVQSYDGLHDHYPAGLSPSLMDFGGQGRVEAVRLDLLKAHDPGKLHEHLRKKTEEGTRVWLDEVLALMPLGTRPLSAAVLEPWPEVEAHPPIPVEFHLEEPGNVTLVIEDRQGKRVRNLVSQRPFPAGENTAWWDGLDDLGRDTDAAGHGLYHVPGELVEPGTYTVRGIVVPPVELTYEISVDNAGSPPWETVDDTGGWGTNHTPPSCVAVCPADRNDLNKELIFIGSYVAEGGHGLFWVDADGRKQGGRHWLGGHWTGAQTVAADVGPRADKETAVYVVSGFHGEVRFVALGSDFSEQILGKYRIAEPKKGNLSDPSFVGDIAVHDGLIVASMPRIDALWLFDAERQALLGKLELDRPHAVGFDPGGDLLASSGGQILRITLDREALSKANAADDAADLPVLDVVESSRPLSAEVTEPRDLTVMGDGRFAVSQFGDINQVRVYSAEGAVEQEIGRPGPLEPGDYDPLRMNRPDGFGVDSRGRFWIAENFTQPKRVGLWSGDGELVEAWYGPSRYGGGGSLDPKDRTLFYNAGMQFKINWDSGDVSVDRILKLDPNPHGNETIGLPRPQFPPDQHHADALPEQAHYVGDRKFLSNWANSNPTNAATTVVVWEDTGDQIVPFAAIGDAYGWWVTESDEFKGRWPEGTPGRNRYDDAVTFYWQDHNGNGTAEPEETLLERGRTRGVSAVMPDLSFIHKLDDRVLRYAPQPGSLRYDFESPETLLSNVQSRKSSGGGLYMPMGDGRLVAYPPPQPYSQYSIGGGPIGGEPDWSYPQYVAGPAPVARVGRPDRTRDARRPHPRHGTPRHAPRRRPRPALVHQLEHGQPVRLHLRRPLRCSALRRLARRPPVEDARRSTRHARRAPHPQGRNLLAHRHPGGRHRRDLPDRRPQLDLQHREGARPRTGQTPRGDVTRRVE